MNIMWGLDLRTGRCAPCYHGIYLEGLRKITRYLSQKSRFPFRDSNTGPPEYTCKKEALSLERNFSDVFKIWPRIVTVRIECGSCGESPVCISMMPLGSADSNKNKQNATQTGHAQFIWLSDNASRFRWTVNCCNRQIVTTATKGPFRASVAYGYSISFS
jgi:hypothetical protein